MNITNIAKIVCFYVLVASCETINGLLRTIYLNKRLGVVSAKRISMLPALFLCMVICYFYVPLIHITTDTGLIYLGMSLSTFMIVFDIIVGRYVAKAKWSVILNDFNIFKGNLLAVGVVIMAFCPLLSSKIPRI